MSKNIWNDPLLLATLKKKTPGGTVSGDIVSFNAPKAAPLKSLRIGIDPVQDLHGYDSPWPAGGGKNKLAPSVNGGSITWNDVTISAQNGELYLSGKATTSGGRTSLRTANFSLPAGSYVISCPTTQFVLHDASSNILANTLGTPTFTLTEETTVYAGFNVVADTTYSGVLKAQIESGSTATTYAPYSNLCPISGWDSVTAWRTGKNLLDPDKRTQTSNNIRYYVSDGFLLKSGQTYTLSISGPPANGLYFVRMSDNSNIALKYNNTKLTYTPTEDVLVKFNIYYAPAPSGGLDDIKCQLELGSTATPYSSYSGNQYTIQLGQTVYGGTLDVTNGVLTVDRAMVLASTLSWTLSGTDSFYATKTDKQRGLNTAICTHFSSRTYTSSDRILIENTGITSKDDLYAYFGTQEAASTPVQLVYTLATPITIPLTATEISTLAGQNVMWADCGDIKNLEYAGKTVINPTALAMALAVRR